MRAIGLPELLIMATMTMFLSVFFLVPCWKIATKAGHPGWYALALCVPLLNLIALWWFAFSDWPSLRQGSSR